jgi:O-antigen ligase
VSEEAKARDEWSQWLVTHNSYTEVSSECGIPAFICYMAIIVACFRMNFRLRKVSANRPEWAEIANLNVALLSYILVYAVCSFFFSVAYTGTLPYCAGQTLALYLAAKQKLDPING